MGVLDEGDDVGDTRVYASSPIFVRRYPASLLLESLPINKVGTYVVLVG